VRKHKILGIKTDIRLMLWTSVLRYHAGGHWCLF